MLCKKFPNMLDRVNSIAPEHINIVVLVDGEMDGFCMCITVKEKLVVRGKWKSSRELSIDGLLVEVEERANDV